MEHYQLNQGPGTDINHYRLTVTIIVFNQVKISTLDDSLVESSQGVWTPLFGKLLSTRNSQAGAVDSDPTVVESPGQRNWQTGDQQHHYNWGVSGSRSGNCGFTCA